MVYLSTGNYMYIAIISIDDGWLDDLSMTSPVKSDKSTAQAQMRVAFHEYHASTFPKIEYNKLQLMVIG